MTLLQNLSKTKMNRTIYFILITSMSFFLIFSFKPSLLKVYANLGDLISGETLQSPEDSIATAADNAATAANDAAAYSAAIHSDSYDSPSPYPSRKPSTLTLTFICTYLVFHSIILTLISIPRMNDCRASRWLTLFLLIPGFNYIIVLLLTILPKAKNADQARSSIGSDLRKAVVALFLAYAVGFVVTFVGAIVMYGVGIHYMQKNEEATH